LRLHRPHLSRPSLIPAEPAAAALTEQWTSIVCTHVDPVLVRQYVGAYLFPRGPGGKPDRAAIDPILEAMQVQMSFLDAAVSTGGHLGGDTFTLADAYLIPILLPVVFQAHREFPARSEAPTVLRTHGHCVHVREPVVCRRELRQRLALHQIGSI
jgi:glutathione S-transferase